MKFMVFTSPSESGLKDPPTAAEYTEQVDAYRQAIADGIIDSIYYGKGRALLLVNGVSDAEVEAFLLKIPNAHKMQRQIEPLEDFFEHAARVRSRLELEDAKRGVN
jgi:hypothetical protein